VVRGDYTTMFWAERGGFAVQVGAGDPVAGEPLDASVDLVRTQPAWLTAAAGLAALTVAVAAAAADRRPGPWAANRR
jgi:hypothetical protein